MSTRKAGSFKWQMMELQDGITTSNGNWYHINSKQIDEYVPGLLKRVPLEKIVREADAWVKSADGLSLFLFFSLIFLSVVPWLAALISIGFYLFWYFNTSAFVMISATPVIKLLINDGFVYLVTAALLIGITFIDSVKGLGLSVDFSALWYGIGLFFLFKVGLMRLSIKFIQSKTKASKVELPDKVLNMILIRYGMREGILTKNIKEMQDDLIDLANYHKKQKKEKH